MARLVIKRDAFRVGHPTTGRISIDRGDGKTEAICLSLELPWQNNAQGVSCIPAGSYRLAFVPSPRYGRKMWRVLDVPKRTGVLIHTANFVRQLRGCIAPGVELGDIDGDGKIDAKRSGPAMEKLLAALSPYEASGLDLLILNGIRPRT